MSSRKSTPQKSVPARSPASHDWMSPIDVDAPCGPDLEYDPEFVVLSAKVITKSEAQYGDFVGSPEPVNWSDVDRDCRRLMMRSKDMRLAVLFTRCRTRLASAHGLAEGIGLLAAWLAAFPDSIHPQPEVDADRDAALEIRMNALQALADTDGLLADVREIALTKSTAIRLQVRDVERAFAHPRPGDALAPESVARQLDDLRAQQPTVMAGFANALAQLAAIDAWAGEHLGVHAPDLSPLTRLLRHVAREDRGSTGYPQPVADNARIGDEAEGVLPDEQMPACELPSPETDAIRHVPAMAGTPTERRAEDRSTALEHIREARQWFERHEPSSPIPVLLKRAEHLVGKRYAEIVHAIPVELLVQWGNDES